MLAQKYLCSIDPNRDKTELELFVEMQMTRDRYIALTQNAQNRPPDAECEGWELRTILHLQESFVTLQLLLNGAYWSNKCWFKCT